MRFVKAAFWEFIQNLPLVTGFVISLHLWRRGMWTAAAACTMAGSVAGSLLIGATESKIVAGHREPVRVMIANAVTMAALMFVLVAYLSASWSSWKTDLLTGALAGVVLGIAQDLAAGERIGLRHGIALAGAAPLALIGIRLLTAALPVLANIIIITLAVTFMVVLIDYGPFSAKRSVLAKGEK